MILLSFVVVDTFESVFGLLDLVDQLDGLDVLLLQQLHTFLLLLGLSQPLDGLSQLLGQCFCPLEVESMRDDLVQDVVVLVEAT